MPLSDVLTFAGQWEVIFVALIAFAIDRSKFAQISLFDNTLEQDFGLTAMVFGFLALICAFAFESAGLFVLAVGAGWFAITRFFPLTLTAIQTAWLILGGGTGAEAETFILGVLSDLLFDLAGIPETFGLVFETLVFVFGWVLVLLKAWGFLREPPALDV